MNNKQTKKERLDTLLVNNGLAPSRQRAQAYIMAGLVTVGGKKIDKCGALFPAEAIIEVHGDSIGYVSRGGLKLAKALSCFSITLNGKIMADIGASTGGFTDCALKHGAAKVFAIDVGYGQLAWSLRTDFRVINMERTNIRNVTFEHLGTKVDFAAIDVAFISLKKVLPVVKQLLKPGGEAVALIKPQFEAGREKVGKKGVVKDPLTHKEVIGQILNCAELLLFCRLGLTYSPIKGPEGNIEYLLYLKDSKDSPQPGESINAVDAYTISEVVSEAHRL